MQTIRVDAVVFNEHCSLELMTFDDDDRRAWKVLFDSWKKLKLGMRAYNAREPNFPEGLSEVAFCLWSESSRLISARNLSNTSFDTYNQKTGFAEQIKAASVEDDLTSFGPRSKWDKLFFLDFYNEGKVDGLFDVYELPTKEIYESKVNQLQTFKDQQNQGKRPRRSVKKFIAANNTEPVATKIKIWL